jgi:hypothetical protein
MLDLTTLELFLSDLFLLELILFELRALPGMITWMLDRRARGALILTRYRSHWGKTLRAAQVASKTEVLGPRGLAVLIVKFGKGLLEQPSNSGFIIPCSSRRIVLVSSDQTTSHPDLLLFCVGYVRAEKLT